MRVFQFTENKLNYLILANVGSKKKFFSIVYDVKIAVCLKSLSFQQIFSRNDKKALYCFIFVFSLKGGTYLEAASLAFISEFVDKNA